MKAEITSVAQLMRAAIFRTGIKGDSKDSDRGSLEESSGTKERAGHCFDFINHDGNCKTTDNTASASLRSHKLC